MFIHLPFFAFYMSLIAVTAAATATAGSDAVNVIAVQFKDVCVSSA